MTDYMKQLETLMGSKHVLVDDWNALGWEFFTIPLSNIRAVSLTNYTECKAEGGTVVFTIEDSVRQTGSGFQHLPVFKIISNEGSGPHGIPWWDTLIPYEGLKELSSIEDLASDLMKSCADEGNCGYWHPWRDEKPHRTLLFKDRAINETEDRLVEVPHDWSEEEWADSMSRSV